jgi:hypothetical protein
MKKIILSLCFLLTAVTFVSAQRAAARKAEISKGLKEQVGLTDAQVESVMSIEAEFRPKVRAITSDSTLGEADKKARHKVLNDEKDAKLVAAVGKDNAKKVEDFYTSLKKEDKGTKAEGEKKSGGKKEKAPGQ